MIPALKWIVAVVGWMVLLIIFAIWKDADTHMGNSPVSAFIRGVVVFGGGYLLYRWARGGKPKEE